MERDYDGRTRARLPFDPATMDIVCRRVPNGRIDTQGQPMLEPVFNIDQTVVSHSPCGFEMGYGGSGPSDFALNILERFVPAGSDGCDPVPCYRGQCSRTAWDLHQEFKRRFVAILPKEGGTIHGHEVRTFLAAHAGEIEARAAEEAEMRRELKEEAC